MNKLSLRLSDKDNVFIYTIYLIGFLFQILLIFKINSNFDFYIPRIMPDDSFYYFKIAENISSGYGSVFSIGEPTNGYHPLWMTILVLTQLVLNPDKNTFVLSSLVISASLNVISSVILHMLLLTLGFSKTQSWIGVICFLFSPWIVNLTFTGLETSIFYTSLFGFLLIVQKTTADDSTQSRKRDILLGLTAGILMLARTDAIFFTIPLFLLILFKKRLYAIRTLFVAGTIATIILLPWLVWNIQQFHTIEQTSSIAMSALNRYSVPSILSIDYWLLSCTFMLWVAHSTIVPLFYTQQPEYYILQYSYTSMIAFSSLLGITLYSRSKITHIIIPKIIWLPAILLIIYYFFIRFFVQIWHMSALHILAIIFFINYIPQGKNIRQRYLLAFIIFLSTLTFYSISNGYFHSQDEIIEQSRTYRSDSVKSLVICASDAGCLGYFSHHTVINVDGIVNNRAKDYILLGRFSDYTKLVGCDEVMLEPQRLKFYDRNM
jgi:hypothetical protein